MANNILVIACGVALGLLIFQIMVWVLGKIILGNIIVYLRAPTATPLIGVAVILGCVVWAGSYLSTEPVSANSDCPPRLDRRSVG